MEKWAGKVVLLTGPTEGLGKYLIKPLIDHGVIVVGVARTNRVLKELEETYKDQKGRFVGFTMDLTDEDGIAEVFENIETNVGPVSVLINMGSYTTNDSLLHDDEEMWEAVLDVNVLGPAVLMKLASNCMKRHKIKGHIINIGGTASYYTSVFPDYHFYSVSKFMLRALGDGLRSEFKANNLPIRVSHIGPGHIKTGCQDRIGLSGQAICIGFQYFGTEYYGMKGHKLPRKFPFRADGDYLYHNDILPALDMNDVTSVIIDILSAEDGAEVMDVIMKPTDRKNSVFESDLYWRS